MSMPHTLIAVFTSSILLTGTPRQDDERSVDANPAGERRALETSTVRGERDCSSVGDSLTDEEVGNDDHAKTRALESLDNLPLAFIENRGQLDERARYCVRSGGLTAYFTDQAFVLQLVRRETGDRDDEKFGRRGTEPERFSRNENDRGKGTNVFLTFEDASPSVLVEGRDELPGRYNYLLGNDPSRWYTDVRGYRSLRYHGLYPGVNLDVREHAGHLEYDLLLEPGADLHQIVVRCDGAQSFFIDAQGALIAETALGPLTQTKPATYQIGPSGEKIAVDCAFVTLDANHFGFAAPSWQPNMPLVIDPLVYSTFLGGSGNEDGSAYDQWRSAIAVDSAGAAYVVGRTGSSDFPTTPGAFATTYAGNTADAFVTKLNAGGSGLVYSTFLGGSGEDGATGIGLDSTGMAYVVGTTFSPDFPTTPGAFDTSHNVQYDAFVTKLNGSGNALAYSTFLGGSSYDLAFAIAADGAGAAYVAGNTSSSDFPTTAGAFDTSYNGGDSVPSDGFVSKLDPSGSTLEYSTFLGGAKAERMMAITVDSASAAYVVGWTQSADFPSTAGAFETSYNGGDSDGFVTKLNPSGSALVYATFLGGLISDAASAIAVDNAGAAYVTGGTGSSDFPITPGAFDTSFNGALDAFVTKLDAGGNALIYSTFVSGGYDWGNAITIDGAGAAYVAGHAESGDFPTTPGAFDTSFNGGHDADAFVTKLNTSGSALAYSTYLGGLGRDWADAIAIDSAGAAYVAGSTNSYDFPATPGAFDTSFNGAGSNSDAFVTKLDLCASASSSNYGSGWPGTLGIPTLTSSPPVLCSSTTISVGNSRGAVTHAVFVVGFSRASISTAVGGTLLLVPGFFVPFTLPAAGANVPYGLCGDEFCGLVVDLQVLEVDPGASQGVSFTQGLELIHGR